MLCVVGNHAVFYVFAVRQGTAPRRPENLINKRVTHRTVPCVFSGHFDIQNNIASKFSLLIDGCVVASDGTVELVNSDIITFTSKNDHGW